MSFPFGVVVVVVVVVVVLSPSFKIHSLLAMIDNSTFGT
jgi:hypothetical protein